MGWSFRKSISYGPFRLNLSKSGIGASVGVKGARISVNKRGTYVNLGSNGIYYRQRIDVVNTVPDVPVENNYSPDVSNHTITTSNLENITDVGSKQFIEELESKVNKISLFPILGLWPSIAFLIFGLVWMNQKIKSIQEYGNFFVVNKKVVNVREGPSKETESIATVLEFSQFEVASSDSIGWTGIYLSRNPDVTGFIRSDMGKVLSQLTKDKSKSRRELFPELNYLYGFSFTLLIIWCAYLVKKDRNRKTLEINYSIDDEVKRVHDEFLLSFKEFSTTKKVWQKLMTHRTDNFKYNSGASELISRTRVSAIYNHKPPSSFLKTNISIPCIQLRNTELYFFPERLILKRGNKFGASFYKNITVQKSSVRFIEEEGVPGDATIVDHTWKYVNKSGGPDRRFSSNRQIPICLYTDYEFYSEKGIHEVITTSRAGGMDRFSDFIKLIGGFQESLHVI